MTVKLLALDLDGTLFGDDLLISARTRRAIRSAQSAGVLVTIATGRMFRSARHIAQDLGIEAPLICYQGALIQQSATADILYHQTVPLDLTHRIISETAARGLHLNIYLNDTLYCSAITPEARFYSKINMDLPINAVGDLHVWLDRQGGAAPTKLVIITDPHHTDAVLLEFGQLFADTLQVTKSHARFTEFTNAECSKGRALAYLASKYGVDRDSVMAIGDGLNDIDMVEWAGYGVAMSNAPRPLLDVARIVAPPLVQDGAASVIERYILTADHE